MKINEKQRLCGGTFFTLILQARKPRMGVREHYMGNTDGLSEPETLIALAKVIVPDMQEPLESMMKTIKGNVFDYKTCKNAGGTYFPFGDADARTAFDTRVKTEYRTALAAMSEFVDGFIDVGGSIKKDERLVRALVELINLDDSIMDGQLFYVSKDGAAISKSDLLVVTDICLQPFLLGVWHFAVLRNDGNTIGKETYVIHLASYMDNGSKKIIDALHRANRLIPELLLQYAEEDDNQHKFFAKELNEIVLDPGRVAIRTMDPSDFERLIADYFRKRGYMNARVIGRSCDRGVDVLATNPEGELELIQCKRYRKGNNIGSTPIQRVDSYMRSRGAKKSWVVTTSDFTPEGYDEARITGVITINGAELIHSLEMYYPGKYRL